MNKTLKFEPRLAEMILAGTKTSTWRLFDDKDLQEGDTLMLINSTTHESFGLAVITLVYWKTLGTLVASDWIGHEKFENEKQMYETYNSYYGSKVTSDTPLKIIRFNLQKHS